MRQRVPEAVFFQRKGVGGLASARSSTWGSGARGFAAAVACALAVGPVAAAQTPLQVLHWWTSAGERRAVQVLGQQMAAEGLQWQDAAIPGGAGIGAAKVLRGRVLAGDAPQATQIIGASIAGWAELGLLLELDEVAAAGQWSTALFPTIDALLHHRGHVVAAPLGIHRINTLFVNRALLARHGLALPRSWADLEQLAQRLQQAGVVPLAQSSEPWQVATLFENLLLASASAELYRELFVQHLPKALDDPRFTEALLRLRRLKGWTRQPLGEQTWTESLRQVRAGEAAMLVMGDWAKGELAAWGDGAEEALACLSTPGTEPYHLYSVDTLVMFAADFSHQAAQEKLARLLLTPQLQQEYNRTKGSVSVRRDADPARMDACARASWTAFAQGPGAQVPSLTHRMATDETSRDALISELHRFFVNDAMSPAELRRRLTSMLRVLQARRARP